MSNKEFVLSVFDKNPPSNLVVENILSRTGLDGEEPFAEENRARLGGRLCQANSVDDTKSIFGQRKRIFCVLV